MNNRQFLTILFFAGLLVWYGPDLLGNGDTAEQSERLAVAHGGSASDTGITSEWLAGETVLKRKPDGHFYADVLVEGRDYRLLVDTGASMIALTGDDARDMGLYWEDSQLIPVGRGASGTVYGVPVTIDRVELGGIEARKVKAAIIPEGLDISLLGQSFLSQIDNVRIDGDRMMLGG
ncbi:MAG: TIGR02281 family clan AA aspartic protease [Novosphingobium sp.]|nr:TIGR02281 family clan AA aspartic protease [Novosphingobium sp.]